MVVELHWISHLPAERPIHDGLEGRIADSIAPGIEALGYELVRVQVSGKEKPVVQIMADRTDGAPITVEDCETISHQVSAVLDVEDPIRGEWMLEVSSPGIDRPLTRIKDWLRFTGHIATVELMVPQDGRRRFRGIILNATPENALLRLDEGGEVELPHGNIRRAKLVLTDELIAATAGKAPAGETELSAEAEEESTPPAPRRGKKPAPAGARNVKEH
jgi:ribosome maturation factor RimP